MIVMWCVKVRAPKIRRVAEIELHNSRPHDLVKFRGYVSECTVRREVLTGPKLLLGVSGGRKQP